MNAHKFIALHGLESAKSVVTSAPDKTATHWEFRKIPNYYSVDFQMWFHDGEWHDSDCKTEEELIDSYGEDFVVNLSELKQVVESVELTEQKGGLSKLKKESNCLFYNGFEGIAEGYEKAIADYELVESYKRDS